MKEEEICKHEHTGENNLLGDYCYDCKKFISGIVKEETEPLKAE